MLLLAMLTILGTGANCPVITADVIRKVRAAGFPNDWTVVVTCNQRDWQDWAAKAKLPMGAAGLGFTSLKSKTTFLNGPKLFDGPVKPGMVDNVMRHEIGHILCNCTDENKANELGRAHDAG
jgi:hypothetical protein